MFLPLLALASSAYRIVDLGLPLGAKKVEAVAINDRAEVLVRDEETMSVPWFNSRGEKGVSQVPILRGYLRRAGRFLGFGKPIDSRLTGDTGNVAPCALNNLGVAVGGEGGLGPIFMTGLSDSDAFIWRGRGLENLGAGGTSQANDINDRGDIVGDAGHRAFVRLRGKLLALPIASHVTPNDPTGEMNDVNLSRGIAINEGRLVLIDSTYGGKCGDSDIPSRPFLVDGARRPLRLVPVPVPSGYVEGRGVALNDRGTVLVFADRRGQSAGMPVLVRGGQVTRLPFAGAMNNRDEVVGGSPLAVWRAGHVTPLPTFPGWTLQTATGINDQGAICGTGIHNGKTRAYILIPFRGFGGRR